MLGLRAVRSVSSPLAAVPTRSLAWSKAHCRDLQAPLKESDPELYAIIKREESRQSRGLELISSENFPSRSIHDALGSCLANKYSEGYPGARYYGGTDHVDESETLARKRALKAMHVDEKDWGVNVQPLSGSPANMAVYHALLRPHDRIMGLDLPSGGHLTHGFYSKQRSISATSEFFESFPYKVDPVSGLIDYDKLEEIAQTYLPKLIIGGGSAYCREWDWPRMRKIADSVGAYLMADMAHISGLVAAGGLVTSPFDYADVVTSTTHKTLRGPRGGLIFFRRGVRGQDKAGNDILYDLENKINFAVFPGLQGGPHQHTIAAVSTAMHLAMKPEYREYQHQVVHNAKFLAKKLSDLGYDISTGGTDMHMFLLDLRSKKIDGARCESLLELAHISLNKNTVPGDTSPLVPSGLRIGTPAMTTRGLEEPDWERVAAFLDEGIKLTKHLKDKNPEVKTTKKFKEFLRQGNVPELKALAEEVETFATQFPMPALW